MSVSALDVAEFILDQLGASSTMKLQKLVFYSHAYHLVYCKEPLISEEIQAWVNGPVIPALYDKHKHKFVIQRGHFQNCSSPQNLNQSELSSVRAALSILGDKSGAELSELTHSEDPWRNAREGCAPTQPSDREITNEQIVRYYSSPYCSNPLFTQSL